VAFVETFYEALYTEVSDLGLETERDYITDLIESNQEQKQR
jgi:hypothetical protein